MHYTVYSHHVNVKLVQVVIFPLHSYEYSNEVVATDWKSSNIISK